MELAKVTSKGQVTIPKSIRDKYGMHEGSKIVFFEENNQVHIMSVHPSTAAMLEAAEAFKGAAEEVGVYTEEDVVNLVREVRREMAEEKRREMKKE